MIKEQVTKKFETPQGQIVDVLFGTSDGELYFTREEAEKASNGAPITPYYRDSEIRSMAGKRSMLTNMIFATDFLKLSKLQKRQFTYEEYVKSAEENFVGKITPEIFEFVRSKVFTNYKMVAPGQKSKIYMYDLGIVNAVFLRRYPQGQIWQVNDFLVLTCSTDTELMRGNYYDMFAPLLGKNPNVHK